MLIKHYNYRKFILVFATLIFINLTLLNNKISSSANAFNFKPVVSGSIREENSMDPSYMAVKQEPGNYPNDNLISDAHKHAPISDSEPLTKPSSSSSSSDSESLNKRFSNKRYSNREILLEEQDFDSEKNDQGQLADQNKKNKDQQASYSAKLYVNDLNEADKSSMVNESEEEEDEDQGEEDNDEKDYQDALLNDLEELLDRKQRTDILNRYHYNNLQELKDFHRQKELQRKLLEQSDNMFNFDYDQMSSPFFKGIDTNDIFNNKNKMSSEDQDYQNVNKFHKFFDDLAMNNQDENEMPPWTGDEKNEMQKLKEILKSITKPVKIKVKEHAYLENEYAEKLKSDSADRQEKPQNPFFADNVDKLNFDTISTKNNANPIDGHSPALIKDQKSGFVDPSINDKIDQIRKQNDYLFIFVVAGCTIAGVVALVGAGVCWYSVHKNSSTRQNVEYGAGGSTKSISSKLSTNSQGDRRLAQSAQMYHYQHQKQQMIAMEKANNDTKPDNSDNSDGETEEGDYTVYECPGLAPTGDMEVKNPLFKEDFSASANNIYASAVSLPPPYSLVNPSVQQQQKELIKQDTNENQLVQDKQSAVAESNLSSSASNTLEVSTNVKNSDTNVSVTIPVNENDISEKH